MRWPFAVPADTEGVHIYQQGIGTQGEEEI